VSMGSNALTCGSISSGAITATGDLNVGTNAVTCGALTASGVVTLPAGSFTAPSLYFFGDTNAGLYHIGADNIGVAVNGVKALDISTTGILSVGKVTQNDGAADCAIYYAKRSSLAANATEATTTTLATFTLYNSSAFMVLTEAAALNGTAVYTFKTTRTIVTDGSGVITESLIIDDYVDGSWIQLDNAGTYVIRLNKDLANIQYYNITIKIMPLNGTAPTVVFT